MRRELRLKMCEHRLVVDPLAEASGLGSGLFSDSAISVGECRDVGFGDDGTRCGGSCSRGDSGGSDVARSVAGALIAVASVAGAQR
jgi:hypothetical protein